MIHLEFRFPGGRYHATPWGHHVNEGLVEWPPSPWRLIRAFIATAFTKLAVPDPVPAEHPLRRLVAALAAELPCYRLPPCPATHSRHYMPLGDKDGKTTLVLDTCAVPGAEPILVSWPVELDPICRELLEKIVASLGYLGRAESWVEARVVSNDLTNAQVPRVEPHIDGMNKGPGWEQVSTLAPISEATYAQTFAAMCREVESRFPIPEGKKKPPAADLKARDAALEPHPCDLFACLTRDTAFLQQHGWSQPPGSRRVLYWRRTHALTSSPVAHTPRHTSRPPIEAVLLALASDTSRREVLPQFYRALPQAELIHRTLIGIAGKREHIECPVLTGKDSDGKPLSGHRHLHILPLNLETNEPGRLDHILLWSPMGIDALAQHAILALRRTWTKGADKPLFVTVAGMGCLADLAPLVGRHLLGKSHTWISRTPFVAPRHIKPNGPNSIDGQVQAELASRGLPSALVEVFNREQSVAGHFHRFVRVRRDSAKAPPQNHFIGLKLTFASPVSGPLALGYASHFGLGLFVPAD
jgi:CRISPR-associated protein Csb2